METNIINGYNLEEDFTKRSIRVIFKSNDGQEAKTVSTITFYPKKDFAEAAVECREVLLNDVMYNLNLKDGEKPLTFRKIRKRIEETLF